MAVPKAKKRTYQSVRFDLGEGIPRVKTPGLRGQKKSPSAWSVMRKDHLAVYPECRVCGKVDRSNHVHHLRYRGPRGTSERPGDLVTLCADHHNELHATLTGSLVDHTISFIRRRRSSGIPVPTPPRTT